MNALFGSGDYTYRVDAQWGRSPQLPALGLVSGVACDSQDRVYVLQREPQAAMLVFSPEGQLLHSWGEDAFSLARTAFGSVPTTHFTAPTATIR